MRYALMIHVAEELWENASEEDREAHLATHREIQQITRQNGSFVGAVRLMPRASAQTVRSRGEERIVLDGPFQETKELIAGLYLLDCKTLEEALEIARKIPTFGRGSIEVRPVLYDTLGGGPGPD